MSRSARPTATDLSHKAVNAALTAPVGALIAARAQGRSHDIRDRPLPHADRCRARGAAGLRAGACAATGHHRSEEHTSELQSLMRISYAVFCLKTKNQLTHKETNRTNRRKEKAK